MKTKLNVLERIILSQVLPKEGNITNLKLLRNVREQLSFTEGENKKLNFKQVEDRLTWDENLEDVEFELGDVVTGLIVKELTRLDKEEKLSGEHLTLCEKFLI